MMLPVLSLRWQKTAQMCALKKPFFYNWRFRCSAIDMADALQKALVSQYRYPSPTTWFGSFRAGPVFYFRAALWTAAVGKWRQFAQNRGVNLRDSQPHKSVVCFVIIKNNKRGTKQCRSNISPNTWPFRHSLLPRLRAVWTMTLSALARVRLQVRQLPTLLMAASLRAPSSVRAQARFATMLSCVNHPDKITDAGLTRACLPLTKKPSFAFGSGGFFMQNISGIPQLNMLKGTGNV